MKKYKSIDHLGNEFATRKEMAKFWNIPPSTLKQRLDKGWSIESALTTPRENEVFDHLGNKFSSLKDLAKFHNINLKNLYFRLEQGWSIEDALSVRKHSTIPKYFLEGNTYYTLQEIISHYSISEKIFLTTYRKTKDLELSLATALEHKASKSKNKFFDLFGNGFKTKSDLAEFWGLKLSALTQREKTWVGRTLKEILETPAFSPKNYSGITDHLGNSFSSVASLCEFHNITTGFFFHRLKQGWSIEEILTYDQSNSCSLGENKISEYLTSKSIDFIKERRFSKTLNLKDFGPLRFDFYIKDLGIIEFDGQQHFYYGWKRFTPSQFKKITSRDDNKTSLCEKHRIPLLRIRFDQIDKIQELIDDFLENPKKYTKKHNKLLSNKKYWEIRKT